MSPPGIKPRNQGIFGELVLVKTIVGLGIGPVHMATLKKNCGGGQSAVQTNTCVENAIFIRAAANSCVVPLGKVDIARALLTFMKQAVERTVGAQYVGRVPLDVFRLGRYLWFEL